MNDIEHLQRQGRFCRGAEPGLGWGIVGTSWIASQLVPTLRANTNQRIVAVGSRTNARAAEFAAALGIERSHGSYSALIGDPEVDAVYIAVTAEQHCALALEAIAAGKPVLVEKPFAVNAAEAAAVRDAAMAAGIFAMEAMWTRYLPQFDAIRLLRDRGALGELMVVTADHGQAITTLAPESRLLRSDLGGGALLDLGVYPLAFAHEVLGHPTAVRVAGNRLPSGVDGTVAMVLTYEGTSAQALLSTTVEARTPITASISGTEARIEIDAPFFVPSGFTLRGPGFLDEPLLRWKDESGITLHQGLGYQLNAMARFIGEGRIESPLQTLEETVQILEVVDRAAAQLSDPPLIG